MYTYYKEPDLIEWKKDEDEEDGSGAVKLWYTLKPLKTPNAKRKDDKGMKNERKISVE